MTEASVDSATATDHAESGGADESQFLLHARIDIAYVLREIARTRTLASVHFGARQQTLLTPIIAVDAAAGEIVFDRSGTDDVNHNLMRAHKLLFVSSQDKVKIRFSTGPARVVERPEGPAFAVAFPDAMLRLQRREFYRVLAPVARPVKCVLPIEEQDGTRYAETRLHDISQGGVSLIAAPGELPNELGTRYPNCRIELPDVGNMIVTLAICHLIETTLLNGKTAVKAGCEFVRPSGSALALVQRYMMKLERENRTRG